MPRKSPMVKLGFLLRNFFCRRVFFELKTYCRGDVIDVGGWDFYFIAKDKGVPFSSWTTLEADPEHHYESDDPRHTAVIGDGCNMTFPDGRFDTAVNIQVLEHVFEPNRMVAEIARVLKPGGQGIFVIPQTSIPHGLPHHYYNFTRYWIREVMRRNHLEILTLTPLGGVWSTMAAHLAQFYVQAFRVKGYSGPEYRRGPLFYVLFPLMVLYTLINIPVCAILSLGDLTEQPKNHLVVVRKHQTG